MPQGMLKSKKKLKILKSICDAIFDVDFLLRIMQYVCNEIFLIYVCHNALCIIHHPVILLIWPFFEWVLYNSSLFKVYHNKIQITFSL